MAAQRYETIAKETDIYYSSKCPVVLCAYAVLLDSKMKKYVAQLKLRNCGSEVISSVSVVVRAYDHFDEVAEEINGYQYVGVNVKQGEEFGTKSLIPLSKKVRVFLIYVIAILSTEYWKLSGDTTSVTAFLSQPVICRRMTEED